MHCQSRLSVGYVLHPRDVFYLHWFSFHYLFFWSPERDMCLNIKSLHTKGIYFQIKSSDRHVFLLLYNGLSPDFISCSNHHWHITASAVLEPCDRKKSDEGGKKWMTCWSFVEYTEGLRQKSITVSSCSWEAVKGLLPASLSSSFVVLSLWLWLQLHWLHSLRTRN